MSIRFVNGISCLSSRGRQEAYSTGDNTNDSSNTNIMNNSPPNDSSSPSSNNNTNNNKKLSIRERMVELESLKDTLPKKEYMKRKRTLRSLKKLEGHNSAGKRGLAQWGFGVEEDVDQQQQPTANHQEVANANATLQSNEISAVTTASSSASAPTTPTRAATRRRRSSSSLAAISSAARAAKTPEIVPSKRAKSPTRPPSLNIEVTAQQTQATPTQRRTSSSTSRSLGIDLELVSSSMEESVAAASTTAATRGEDATLPRSATAAIKTGTKAAAAAAAAKKPKQSPPKKKSPTPDDRELEGRAENSSSSSSEVGPVSSNPKFTTLAKGIMNDGSISHSMKTPNNSQQPVLQNNKGSTSKSSSSGGSENHDDLVLLPSSSKDKNLVVSSVERNSGDDGKTLSVTNNNEIHDGDDDALESIGKTAAASTATEVEGKQTAVVTENADKEESSPQQKEHELNSVDSHEQMSETIQQKYDANGDEFSKPTEAAATIDALSSCYDNSNHHRNDPLSKNDIGVSTSCATEELLRKQKPSPARSARAEGKNVVVNVEGSNRSSSSPFSQAPTPTPTAKVPPKAQPATAVSDAALLKPSLGTTQLPKAPLHPTQLAIAAVAATEEKEEEKEEEVVIGDEAFPEIVPAEKKISLAKRILYPSLVSALNDAPSANTAKLDTNKQNIAQPIKAAAAASTDNNNTGKDTDSNGSSQHQPINDPPPENHHCMLSRISSSAEEDQDNNDDVNNDIPLASGDDTNLSKDLGNSTSNIVPTTSRNAPGLTGKSPTMATETAEESELSPPARQEEKVTANPSNATSVSSGALKKKDCSNDNDEESVLHHHKVSSKKDEDRVDAVDYRATTGNKTEKTAAREEVSAPPSSSQLVRSISMPNNTALTAPNSVEEDQNGVNGNEKAAQSVSLADDIHDDSDYNSSSAKGECSFATTTKSIPKVTMTEEVETLTKQPTSASTALRAFDRFAEEKDDEKNSPSSVLDGGDETAALDDSSKVAPLAPASKPKQPITEKEVVESEREPSEAETPLPHQSLERQDADATAPKSIAKAGVSAATSNAENRSEAIIISTNEDGTKNEDENEGPEDEGPEDEDDGDNGNRSDTFAQTSKKAIESSTENLERTENEKRKDEGDDSETSKSSQHNAINDNDSKKDSKADGDDNEEEADDDSSFANVFSAALSGNAESFPKEVEEEEEEEDEDDEKEELNTLPSSFDLDIFFGRGGFANRKRQGSLYRELVMKHAQEYEHLLQREKRGFVFKHIIKPLQKVGSKFYTRNPSNAKWMEMTRQRDIEYKVMQAVRDCHKPQHKVSEENPDKKRSIAAESQLRGNNDQPKTKKKKVTSLLSPPSPSAAELTPLKRPAAMQSKSQGTAQSRKKARTALLSPPSPTGDGTNPLNTDKQSKSCGDTQPNRNSREAPPPPPTQATEGKSAPFRGSMPNQTSIPHDDLRSEVETRESATSKILSRAERATVHPHDAEDASFSDFDHKEPKRRVGSRDSDEEMTTAKADSVSDISSQTPMITPENFLASLNSYRDPNPSTMDDSKSEDGDTDDDKSLVDIFTAAATPSSADGDTCIPASSYEVRINKNANGFMCFYWADENNSHPEKSPTPFHDCSEREDLGNLDTKKAESLDSDTAWDMRLSELKYFKDIRGHCNVPEIFEPNQDLATWVHTQRHQYKLLNSRRPSRKPCPLTWERVIKLEELGFRWEVSEINTAIGNSMIPSPVLPNPLTVGTVTPAPFNTPVTNGPPMPSSGHDIVCDIGDFSANPGNKRFQALIKNCVGFTTSENKNDRGVAEEIVKHVTSRNPSGRFLKTTNDGSLNQNIVRDPNGSSWVVLTHEESIEVTLQALRDCASATSFPQSSFSGFQNASLATMQSRRSLMSPNMLTQQRQSNVNRVEVQEQATGINPVPQGEQEIEARSLPHPPSSPALQTAPIPIPLPSVQTLISRDKMAQHKDTSIHHMATREQTMDMNPVSQQKDTHTHHMATRGQTMGMNPVPQQKETHARHIATQGQAMNVNPIPQLKGMSPQPILVNQEGRTNIEHVFDNNTLRETKGSSTGNSKQGARFMMGQTENWTHRLMEATRFRHEKGHCCIPCEFPQNQPLANWAKRQRYQYKLYQKEHPQEYGTRPSISVNKEVLTTTKSTLTLERIIALEKIGFCWDTRSFRWFSKFEELKTWAKTNGGNCNKFPSTHKNKALMMWIKCQRHQYTKLVSGERSTLNEERVRLLNSIGFNWAGKTKTGLAGRQRGKPTSPSWGKSV